MDNVQEARAEKFLRFSRRSMTVLLLLVLGVGALCFAMALQPFAPQWQYAMLPLWIVAFALVMGLQRTLGGEHWDLRTPEVRAIVDDEWRQSNMDRARRMAFVVVLGAQLPLALLLPPLPQLRALMAMATSTITLGLSTLLAIFLYLDRDASDAG